MPVDEQAAERVAVLHHVDRPTVPISRGKQLIPRRPDIAATGPGEGIQILGRARCKTLRQQRPSPSQQEPVTGRQAEEQLRHVQLKCGQATTVRAKHYASTGTSTTPRT
jgi:hypothetical protein